MTMLAIASKPRGERSSVRAIKLPAALLTSEVNSPPVENLLDHRIDGACVADVDAIAFHDSTVSLHHLLGSCVANGLPPAADSELGPKAEQPFGHPPAEPGAAAGDEDFLALEQTRLKHRAPSAETAPVPAIAAGFSRFLSTRRLRSLRATPAALRFGTRDSFSSRSCCASSDEARERFRASDRGSRARSPSRSVCRGLSNNCLGRNRRREASACARASGRRAAHATGARIPGGAANPRSLPRPGSKTPWGRLRLAWRRRMSLRRSPSIRADGRRCRPARERRSNELSTRAPGRRSGLAPRSSSAPSAAAREASAPRRRRIA